MKEVRVDDIETPREPRGDLDSLTDYLVGHYMERRKEITLLLQSAKDLGDKGTLIELVYETLLFRAETDEWLAFATQILDEAHGDQLGVAHEEQASEARERGSARPLSKVVEARAEQFTAPLRRAVSELRSNRDFLDKILFWAQAQPKLIRDEEYGSLLEARNVPKDDPIKHPPSLDRSLKKMR
jgi:hypothetical protein